MHQFWKKNPKFIDTGSNVKAQSKSENLISSGEISIPPTVAAQRLPLSSIPVAPAITPVITPRHIHICDPSDIDLPFPLPPLPLTKTVARKSKSFKHRKSIDAIFCDKQNTSVVQKNLNQLLLQIYPIWKLLLI